MRRVDRCVKVAYGAIFSERKSLVGRDIFNCCRSFL